LDPRFPEPLLDELDINLFAESDHGHDQKTGRYISGLFGFVGSTPVILESIRQACVNTQVHLDMNFVH
jgi:hypothetical protein